MNEKLTAARNFDNIFPSDIQNLSAADIFQFSQNFHVVCKSFVAHFQLSHQSNFCVRDNLFNSRIFLCRPPKFSRCNKFLSLGKIKTF